MSLIDNETIAKYTDKIYTTSQKSSLDRICLSVEKMFEKMSGGRIFAPDSIVTATKVKELESDERLYLPTRIVEVVSIKYLSDYDPETWTDLPVPYIVRSDHIKFNSAVTGDIEVVYKAELLPDDVKQAMIEWAMLIYASRVNQGKQTSSEGRGTSTNSYMTKDSLPVLIKQVIDANRIYNV